MPSYRNMPKKQCKYAYRLYVTGTVIFAVAFMGLLAYVITSRL